MRRVGMRQVGDRPQDRVGSRRPRVQLGLGRGRLFAQRAALGLAGFALGGVLGLADRLADFVGLAVQFVDFDLPGFALGFQFDEPRHVGLRAAAAAVLLHEVHVFHDKSAVEHERQAVEGVEFVGVVGYRRREL